MGEKHYPPFFAKWDTCKNKQLSSSFKIICNIQCVLRSIAYLVSGQVFITKDLVTWGKR